MSNSVNIGQNIINFNNLLEKFNKFVASDVTNSLDVVYKWLDVMYKFLEDLFNKETSSVTDKVSTLIGKIPSLKQLQDIFDKNGKLATLINKIINLFIATFKLLGIKIPKLGQNGGSIYLINKMNYINLMNP